MDTENKRYAVDLVTYCVQNYLTGNVSEVINLLENNGKTCHFEEEEHVYRWKTERIYVDSLTWKYIKILFDCAVNEKENIIDKIIRAWVHKLNTEHGTDWFRCENRWIIDNSPCDYAVNFHCDVEELNWDKFMEWCNEFRIAKCVMFRNACSYYLEQLGMSIP